MLKRIFFYSLCCGLIVVFFNGALEASFLEWHLAAQNEAAALYIHPETTEIAIHSIATGKRWFSNPQSREAGRSVGQEIISIRYDAPAVPDRSMNSFEDSVRHRQFTISPLPQGVRVEYLLGEEYGAGQVGLPQMIKAERLEHLILDKISDERERSSLQRYYTLVSLEKPTEAEKVGSAEIRALEKQLFGEYILVAHTDEYRELKAAVAGLEARLSTDQSNGEARDSLRDARRQLEKIRGDLVYGLIEKLTGYAIGGLETRTEGYRADAEKPADLSPADFKHLIGEPTYLLGKVPPFIEKQLAVSLEKIGYGIEDLTADHLANYLDPPLPNQIVFRIPVEYILAGPDLVVRIPMQEVEYPQVVYGEYSIDFEAGPAGKFLSYDESGVQESYPLTGISLLRFFGAGGKEEDGFLLVPDGCGALINFNNGKSNLPLYSAPVYGPDPAIPVEETSPFTKQANRLPVFGIKHEDGGILAIIEKGEALAAIRADIARESVPYNTAFAAFEVTPKSSRRLDQHTEIVMYQRRIYEGDLQIRYRFLDSGEATYPGLAASYRRYLWERGLLPGKTTADVPFFLEVTGAVSAKRPVLGVPREVALPLTTFAQAQELVELLVQKGISKPYLRYNGWLQGGLEHTFPSRARLEKKLGTARDFENLKTAVQEMGGVLYPDVRFLEVYKSRLGDGFLVRRDAARAVTGLIAQVHPYDPVLLAWEPKKSHYLITPGRLDSLVGGFLTEYKQYSLPGISLSQMGLTVHSDFRGQAGRVIDRQQAVEMLEKQLAKFKQVPLRVLIEGGNAFALPYSDGIIGAPLHSTGYDLIDWEVPFYPLVIRGSLDFAGTPLNLSPSWRHEVLKAVETGAGLCFSWVYGGEDQLKGTEFADLYDVAYQAWLARAVQVYERVSAALAGLAGQIITDHLAVQPGVYKTTFAGGDAVFVNYNDFPVKLGATSVAALGFTRRKVGERHEEISFSLDFD